MAHCHTSFVLPPPTEPEVVFHLRLTREEAQCVLDRCNAGAWQDDLHNRDYKSSIYEALSGAGLSVKQKYAALRPQEF